MNESPLLSSPGVPPRGGRKRKRTHTNDLNTPGKGVRLRGRGRHAGGTAIQGSSPAMVKIRGNERGLRKEGGGASAEEKTCAQGSSCEEGPKRPGLRVLQEKTCWENTTPNCCGLVLNEGTGSYLSPASLLTVLGTSAACQGETGKVRKPGSLHPRPHQEERADTPAAGWATRESLLG